MQLTSRARSNGRHPSAPAARPHRVVAELDARGEVDRHATMCLRNAIGDALAGGARAIVVDLRDLTSIDLPALAVFVRARADCHAGGAQLELLISACPRHDAIVRAFRSVGLSDRLDFTCEPLAPAPRERRMHRVASG